MNLNNGWHNCINAIQFIHNKLQITFRKFWQRTEWGKFPIHFHWCNCGRKD